MRMRTIIRWHKKRRENTEKSAQLRSNGADVAATPSQNLADNDQDIISREQRDLATAA